MLWCFFPRAVRSLSSPLCALLCLAVLAVVPRFPVLCAVALCCRVVLWPVVLCCAVLLVGCAVFCLVVASACCGARSLLAGTHKSKTLIIALGYPAPVSVSVVHVVGEVGFVFRRVIAHPRRVVCEKVVLFVVVPACLQQNGGGTRRGWGRDGKGMYVEKRTKQEGASLEA